MSNAITEKENSSLSKSILTGQYGCFNFRLDPVKISSDIYRQKPVICRCLCEKRTVTD